MSSVGLQQNIEGGVVRGRVKNEAKVTPGWSLVSHINRCELYFKDRRKSVKAWE